MPLAVSTRAEAEELDAQDVLAARRELFELPPEVIYLDGNSLGALPRHVPAVMQQVISAQWGRDLIRSWNSNGWWEAPRRVAARIAPMIGADLGEVTVTDNVTVNLFKLLMAGLRLQPGRTAIVTDPDNFPTDLYVVNEVAALVGGTVRHARPDRLGDVLDEGVALVAFTEVDYRSGARFDMDAVTEQAHAAGSLALWDLSHSVGAFPVALAASGADLAVGCTYKYLNGGPGAPAFAFVNRHHHERLHQPIVGWHGHADPFGMEPEYRPGPGIERLRTGTSPILSTLALEAALDVFDGVDLDLVRAKSVALTELFVTRSDARLAPFGLEVATPRNPTARGSHVSLVHRDAYAVCQALIARGVIGDFRGPNLLRFGFAPLYVRFVDVWDAVETIAEVLASGVWQDSAYSVRRTVT